MKSLRIRATLDPTGVEVGCRSAANTAEPRSKTCHVIHPTTIAKRNVEEISDRSSWICVELQWRRSRPVTCLTAAGVECGLHRTDLWPDRMAQWGKVWLTTCQWVPDSITCGVAQCWFQGLESDKLRIRSRNDDSNSVALSCLNAFNLRKFRCLGAHF